MPVRYMAIALGVPEANTRWDQATQKVTLIKGDKVVKVTIGSKVMMINDTSIMMDVPPELVDPGRTMLPFRFIAQAFGADVTWNEANQQVITRIN